MFKFFVIGGMVMNHELPKLSQFIRKDFCYFNNVNKINIRPLVPKQEMIFSKLNNKLSCLELDTYLNLKSYNVPLDHMPWQLCGTVSKEEDWPSIEQKLESFNVLLVQDKKWPIGWLNAAEITRRILSSFNFLKACYDSILDTTEGSITLIDENKHTVVWTKGAEKLFSIKKEDIIGKPITKFFPEQMLETLNTLMGKSVNRKLHQPREDLFVLINSNPIKINEKIVGAVVTEIDVTQQVLLNRELANANNTINSLRKEVSRLKPSFDPFQTIKGSSSNISQVIEKVKQIGTTQARVLILGESGVGKELFARALHDIRLKSHAPFIPVNCGAIPPSLFESELFGYEKGAFSGADSKGKKGKIDLAQGGTLFLDEVGDLPFDMQVKMLRVLQEGTYYPVGSIKEKQTDCHIIAATNRDLIDLVKEGKFREDLYYRLNIISITIPPLRDRIEDVVELSHLFLYEFAEKYHRAVSEIPKPIMQNLLSYNWPGNIRELRNVIERLVVFSENGKMDGKDLPFNIEIEDDQSFSSSPLMLNYSDNKETTPLKDAVQHFERDLIIKTIEENKGNKLTAAKQLGVSRATLYNKMKNLDIL
jgi:PAS domain S-box-containing protein